jgi:hypothetical protein
MDKGATETREMINAKINFKCVEDFAQHILPI